MELTEREITAVHHMRGDCHDSTACPLCDANREITATYRASAHRAGQDGYTRGYRDAINSVAGG